MYFCVQKCTSFHRYAKCIDYVLLLSNTIALSFLLSLPAVSAKWGKNVSSFCNLSKQIRVYSGTCQISMNANPNVVTDYRWQISKRNPYWFWKHICTELTIHSLYLYIWQIQSIWIEIIQGKWARQLTGYLLFISGIMQLTTNAILGNAPLHKHSLAWAKWMVQPKVPYPFILAPGPQVLCVQVHLASGGMGQCPQHKSLSDGLTISVRNPKVN